MKYYTKIFLLSIIFISLFSSKLLADDEDQWKLCKETLDRGDIIRAISCFQDYVQSNKKDAKGYLWLGKAFLKADSTDQAVMVLIQGRELDSANAQFYDLLGDAYAKQNIYAAAIQQYQLAAELDSANKISFVKLAKANMKARQYTDAARAFLKALALDTSNIDVNRDLGNLYIQAKQYSNAISLFERLTKFLPDTLQVHTQLVKALYHTRSYERLITVAQKVMRLDSNQTEVLRMLGVAYIKTHDNENAEKALLKLEQKGTLKAEDYLDLAKAQKGLDKVDEAIGSYEKAYQADSTLSDIYYDLGSLYMKRKRYPEAIVMFDKKIAADSASSYRFASYLNMGLCLMQTKEFQRARTSILESINLRPDYIQAWMYLAQCYAQMDSTGPQRVAYKKVVELVNASNNGNAEKYKNELEEAYRMEGFFLLLEKKYAAAIEHLKMALQFDSKNCQTLLWTAQAYALSNIRDESKKYYCKVLALCPKNEDAIKGIKILGGDPAECGK